MIPQYDYPQVFFSEQYDASTSLINCGAHTEQTPFAQTNIALVFPLGSGETATSTVFSVTPSASNNGCRMYVGDNTAQPNIVFNAHSTGSAGNPTRAAAANTCVYNKWNFIVSTWDGGLTASNIKFYIAIDGATAVEAGYFSAGTDGVTAAASGAGNNLILGNRGDAGRTMNGSMAYVARWQRVLSLGEIQKVQRLGPLSIPDGLIFCWANGRDYGPYGVAAVQKIAITQRTAPTVRYPLGPRLFGKLALNSVAAAGVKIRYYYDMLAA